MVLVATRDGKSQFEELKQIANLIYNHNHVQFTTESPSSHQEGRCPVLDLQMFVGVDGTILYKFYEKPCASKFVIPEKSAHSKQIKMLAFNQFSGFGIFFLASWHFDHFWVLGHFAIMKFKRKQH